MPDPVNDPANAGNNNNPGDGDDAAANFAALRTKLEKREQATIRMAAKMAGYDPENPTVQLIMREFAKQDEVEYDDESFLAFAKDTYKFDPAPKNDSTPPPNDANNNNNDGGNTTTPTSESGDTTVNALDNLHSSGTSPSDPTDLDTAMDHLKAGNVRQAIETKVTAILGDPSRGIKPKITQDNPYIL